MSRSRSLVSKVLLPLLPLLPFAATAAATLCLAEGTAHAEITPPTTLMGEKGQLWIDQVSGFRVSGDGTLSYYGPIGFSVRSISEDSFAPVVNTSTTLHLTTFWLAPSADVFVIDHLSVGGLIEFSTTSSSVDFNQGGVTTNFSQPTTTNFTFLPRIGWLFGISDRFGIWPRLGLGYATRQSNSTNAMNTIRDSISGFTFDLDVGFIFRFTDSLFLKAAPELSLVPGGGHSRTDQNGNSVSANASAFQFAGVTGVGVIFDL